MDVIALDPEGERELAIVTGDGELTVKGPTEKTAGQLVDKFKPVLAISLLAAQLHATLGGFRTLRRRSHQSTGIGRSGARERRSEGEDSPPLIARSLGRFGRGTLD